VNWRHATRALWAAAVCALQIGCVALQVDRHSALTIGVAAVEYHTREGTWPVSQPALVVAECAPGRALDFATRAAADGTQPDDRAACTERFGAAAQRIELRMVGDKLLIDVQNLGSGQRCQMTAAAAARQVGGAPVAVGRVTTSIFRCSATSLVRRSR